MSQNPTVKPNGPAIRYRRNLMGLTQKQLGKKAERSATYVCEIECGRHDKVGVITIGRFARVLKTDPEKFIEAEAA